VHGACSFNLCTDACPHHKWDIFLCFRLGVLAHLFRLFRCMMCSFDQRAGTWVEGHSASCFCEPICSFFSGPRGPTTSSLLPAECHTTQAQLVEWRFASVTKSQLRLLIATILLRITTHCKRHLKDSPFHLYGRFSSARGHWVLSILHTMPSIVSRSS
jgi:hypothetical protein